jgi:hypothetical protein
MKSLIYLGVFFDHYYVNLLSLCLKSLVRFGNIPPDTDILVFTSYDLAPYVDTAVHKVPFNVRVESLKEITTLRDAFGQRLSMPDYVDIFQYERILYLDTDILIGSSIEMLFSTPLKDDTVYAMKNGNLNHECFCRGFFDFSVVDGDISSVNSGVYLFKPSQTMKRLFATMYADFKSGRVYGAFTEQSYFAYHLFINKCYDNEFLNDFIACEFKEGCPRKPIYHFVGPIAGDARTKLDIMNEVFYNHLMKTDKA